MYVHLLLEQMLFRLNNFGAKVRLWDPKTGKAIGNALKGHTKWVTSLAWEPIHMYVSSHRLYLYPIIESTWS